MSSEVQSSPTLPESGKRRSDVECALQNLAAMFAEFMGSSPMHLFHSHAPLSLRPGLSWNFAHPLAQPSATMQSTLPAADRRARQRLKEMQSTIDALKRQLFELQSLVRSSQEQCAYYKERAVIFKALYAQQQGISERTMAMLVQLRHRQQRLEGVGHTSLASVRRI
ncbi:hypothetical protein BKA70DRAFT_1240501 [Coprinopsis sp. MPI-PUGE-AT-0042]|nr:hypothetical protein BKA70DRAFT_1240501 [Coprinopsis sp. MPI-PUGE-AT-0042]